MSTFYAIFVQLLENFDKTVYNSIFLHIDIFGPKILKIHEKPLPLEENFLLQNESLLISLQREHSFLKISLNSYHSFFLDLF